MANVTDVVGPFMALVGVDCLLVAGLLTDSLVTADVYNYHHHQFTIRSFTYLFKNLTQYKHTHNLFAKKLYNTQLKM